MREQAQLYFIAIMLPPTVDAEVIRFKNDMAGRFQSKKALRTASHITGLGCPEVHAPGHGNSRIGIAIGKRWFRVSTH